MPENADSSTGPNWGAERAGLVADALHLGGRIRLRVHGESMLPTLWPGDEVEIESCSPEDVQPGEIVLAQKEDRLFLHRFVRRCSPNGFVMTGDSMPGPDPPYPAEALLGRLARREEPGRFPEATPRPGFASKWLGFEWPRAFGIVLCYSSLARRLALRLHSRRNTWRRDPLSDDAAGKLESL
jgi:hypothetical protein